MSYVAREYLDASEGDNQDYEKTKPADFAKYFKQIETSKLPDQVSPQVQRDQPGFKERATEQPPSFAKYFGKKSSEQSVSKKNEEGAFSKAIRPVSIYTNSLAADLQSGPRTAYDLAKYLLSLGSKESSGSIGGLGSQLLSGLKHIEESAPDKFKDIMNFIFPSYEDISKEQKEKFGAPTPEGTFENFLEKAGRFSGASAYNRGGSLLREGAGIVGAAGGAQLGEELDLNPLANAALTFAGGALGHKAAGGRRAASELSRQRITPEAERYIQASRDIGIDPLLTGMNPSQLQKVAQKWGTHGVGGPQILEDAYRTRSGQVSRAFEQGLDQIGQRLVNDPFEAGTLLQESVRDATRQVEHTKAANYRAMERARPAGVRIVPQNRNTFLDNANQTLQHLDLSLSQTPRETALYNRLSNARDQIRELLNKGRSLPIDRLEATVRSLNDVIRWNKPGGADKLLVPFARQLDNELIRYGNTNPAYQTARRNAQDYFKNEVVQIRQNILQSIARGEKPEAALQIMESVSGVRNVEKALSHLPDGRRIFDALKRYKFQQMVMDRVIDPSTGLMKLGPSGHGLHNFLSKKSDVYPLLQELIGPRALRHFHRLEHVGEGLAKGFGALANPSKTADTLLAIQSVLGPSQKIIEGVKKLPTPGGALDILGGGFQLLAPRVAAKMILDPDFADMVYEASRAAQRGQFHTFNRIMTNIDASIKSGKEEEKPKRSS